MTLTGSLAADLAKREAEGRPIRIGLIGSGEMGTDIVTQCRHMMGITVAAIAETHVEHAKRALRIADYPDTAWSVVESASACDDTVKSGRVAIAGHADAVCRSELIDVVIDATGRPAAGAEIGLGAEQHGKLLVMMHVEADVAIGAYMQQDARRLGVGYAGGAAVEPS